MRWGRFFTVVVVLVLIAGAACLAINPFSEKVKLGLDLKGGVMVRLEATEKATNDDLEKAIAVLDNRINGLGVTEPEIRKEGDNRIIVELPGVENPEEAVKAIGKMAQLEFRRVDNGELVISGKDLKNAQEGMDPNATSLHDKYFVSLELNKEGASKFSDATKDLIEKYSENDPNRSIAIILDGQVLSTPYVKTIINDGKASISGGYQSLEEAHSLAVLLRSGALPVELKVIEKRTVGPKLGLDSLEKSQSAAIYGLLAIVVFMLLFYRVPGFIAGFSLALYSLIVWGVLIFINATITLPGIAGFLLSVGMAVDSNIIIFERIKEELRNKKSLRAAIDAGFSRALWTILDANVTTLIAAGVLIYFGQGTIRGFAITLSIGIVASLFTAITFTRFILRQLALSGVIKNNKFYGA